MKADEVKAALWHYVYKNHDFSPSFCSGCEKVQQAIDEYAGRPLRQEWCRPEMQKVVTPRGGQEGKKP